MKKPESEVKQEVKERPPEVGFITLSKEKVRRLQESLKKVSFVCLEEIKEIEGWLT